MAITISEELTASGGKRFVTYCIDAVAYCMLILLLGIISYFTYNWFGFHITPFSRWDFSSIIGKLWFMVLWLVYYFISEIIWQRTIGKLITATMVVSIKGEKPLVPGMLVRTLTRVVPFGMVFFDERIVAKTLHDRASGTCVVDAKKYKDALQLKNAIDEIGTFAS